MNRKRILGLVVLAAAALLPAQAATLYVDTLNAGCNDAGAGSSQVPFCTIQAAYDAAAANDEVRVRPGTYEECVLAFDLATQKGVRIVADAFLNSGDRTTTIIDATNVAAANCQFPQSGQAASVVNLGGNGTRFEGFTVRGGTASGIFAVGGVTITNNVVRDNTSTFGGGIYIYTANCYYGNATMTVTNNLVNGNSASFQGGGISVTAGLQSLITDPEPTTCPLVGNAAVTVQGNTISNNTADNDGGGVFATLFADENRSASVVITQNTISGNTASTPGEFGLGYGGGVYGLTYGFGQETLVVSQNTISDNESTFDLGGGVSVSSVPSASASTVDHSILVENNTVTSNRAGLGGGGLDLFVSTLDMIAPQSVSLIARENTVTGNSLLTDEPGITFGGGGILAFYESLASNAPSAEFEVDENIVGQNSAFGFGGGVSAFLSANSDPNDDGGIAVTTAGMRLDNNRITGNSATSNKQGFDASGGGLFALVESIGNATATLDARLGTYSDNSLDNQLESGGIHAESFTNLDALNQFDGQAILNVDSSIVSANDGLGVGGPRPGDPGIVTPGGNAEFTVNVTYNDVHGNVAGGLDTSWIVAGTGNITTDPQLDASFEPARCSPTIDAANPARGFADEPQPNGGRANMGHSGGTSDAVRTLADVSGDRAVDGLDLLRLSVAFGSATGQPRFSAVLDLDKDGMVDGDDLALMSPDFGFACP